MVTGDQHAIAVETCKRLGMGTKILEGKQVMAGLKEDEGGKADPVLIQHCDECDGFAGALLLFVLLGVQAGCHADSGAGDLI